MPHIRARQFDQPPGQAPVSNLLTPELQDRLSAIATLMEFDENPAHDAVVREGAPAPCVYIIARGIVRLSRNSTSGRHQIISFLLPGDVFGIPEQGQYPNTATAIGHVSLYQVPWTELCSLFREEPQLQNSFLTRLAYDLQEAQKRIVVLGQQNVSQRLASFLLELMDHADFYDPQTRHLLLPISRFDLADYIGTSAETVVRVIAQLEKDQVIRRLSSRTIELCNPAALTFLLRRPRRTDH